MHKRRPVRSGAWLPLLVLLALYGSGLLAQEVSPDLPPENPLVPIEVGSRDDVGRESLASRAARGVAGGVIGGVLGQRGVRQASPPPGPRTRRDPTRRQDYVAFEKPELGIATGARARWTDDGLLISSRILEHDERGTFQSIFLEACDGSRIYPRRMELYELWREVRLTVSWTRTQYVDGQVVSRESGGWSEAWTERLNRRAHDDAELPGIWQLYGFERAHAGIQQMGAYFNVEPGELAELGRLALIVHVTRPDLDPVVTEPFHWPISGDDPQQPQVLPAAEAWPQWESECLEPRMVTRPEPETEVEEPPPAMATVPREEQPPDRVTEPPDRTTEPPDRTTEPPEEEQEAPAMATVPREDPPPAMATVPRPDRPAPEPEDEPPPDNGDPPRRPPPEWPPGDPPPDCSVTVLQTLPDPPIKVRLVAPDALEDFPWPRPVPLQIRARDYDMLIGQCDGCDGGTSEIRLPLEDRIGEIHWELLSEHGSLNQPYIDIDDLEATQAEIDALRARIREISAEIAELELERARLEASRDERREQLEDEIKGLEAALADARDRQAKVAAEADDSRSRISELEQQLSERRQQIEARQAEIENHRAEIEELQDRIAGRPSAATRELSTQLEGHEAELEAAQGRLRLTREAQAQTEQDLREALQQAEAALDQAVIQRDALAAQALALQDRIRALEAELFDTVLMRQIFNARHRIDSLLREMSEWMPEPLDSRDVFRDIRRLARVGPQQREEVLEEIRGRAHQMLSRAQAGCTHPECASLVHRLGSEVRTLDDLLDEAIENPGRLINAEVAEQLQAVRDELAALNPEVEAAEAAVARARRTTDQARQTLLDRLRGFESELEPLRADIERVEAQIADVAARLAEQQLADALETERNRPGWEAEIAELRSRIDESIAEIDRLRIEMAGLSQELVDEEQRLTEILMVLAGHDDEVAMLEHRLNDRQARLATLETEDEDIEARIEELENEREQLEARLEELLASSEDDQQGKREATGAQAWFIPPPLEKLLEDPETFDRLKREIGEREADLAAALGEKAGRQKEAFDIIKTAVRVLWQWRAANDRIDALDAQIDALESDRARQRADNVLAGQERLAQAMQRKNEIEAEKAPAQAELDQAREQEKAREGEIEDADAAVEAARQALDAAREAIAEAEGQLRFQVRQREAKEAAVNEQRSRHEALVQQIRTKETELAATGARHPAGR
jgi:DNA repair exonuclease SbcCD ATPase subunit